MEFQKIENSTDLVTQKVEELLSWMETDEYWLKHGECSDEHMVLMNQYIILLDGLGIRRNNKLVVKYDEIRDRNKFRSNVLNNTSHNKVNVVTMSGYEFKVAIDNTFDVHTLKINIELHFYTKLRDEFIEKYGNNPRNDEYEKLMNEELYKPLQKYDNRCIDLLHDENILNNHDRLIITDDTVLTMVVNSTKYGIYRRRLNVVESDSDSDESDSEDED